MTYVKSDDRSSGSNGRPEGAVAAGAAWTVGPWRIDAGTGELRRGNESQRVEPKVAEVLVFLAQRPGQMVSRDELLTAVWPGVVVGDDALTQAVIKLRKALGDDARRPAYIETLAKRGYRLIAPVARVTEAGVAPPATPPAAAAAEAAASPPTAAPPPPAGSPARRKPWRLALLVGGLAALALAAGLAVGIHRDWRWPIGSDSAPHATAETLPVVAVLPLANQSGDPQREFFSDGVTDDIIHALGRYSGLRVISRNSVQQFKQREATPQIVRNELGARYVITGGVREGDGQVRIAVELSDAQTARVLWSERFEREGKGVFEIKDSIVQSVVAALAIKVTKLESDRAATRPPSRLEAYDLVLLARSFEAKSQRAANRQGRALVAKARELAPDYAMAYVVASELDVQRADQGWMEDPAQGLMLAERAARHALTIDDSGANARAHAMLARIHSFRGEHERALAESERARTLNPSDIFIAEIRAQTLLWAGRSNEAVALLESALRLDPAGRSSPVRHVIVVAYFVAERYPEALAACERALADHPDLPLLHTMRAAILAQTGRLEEARQSAAEVRRLQPNFPVTEFGSRFADSAPRARLQEALRKAGL
jgi:TolB-like protein/DNA-binding winged helix-turn-helix (wHTH) protein/Tfp pilus assembly protein PilF